MKHNFYRWMLAVLLSCGLDAFAKTEFEIKPLFKRNDVIWGLDFLPDGKIVFTERGGKMGVYDSSKKSYFEVAEVPEVATRNQGGLLDVRVHPDFAQNQLIFFSYSGIVGKKLPQPMLMKMTTTVARAKLVNDGGKYSLRELKTIFVAHEPDSEDHHFGSRLVLQDGMVYITSGDRHARDHVQDLRYTTGKILRINEDGSIPQSNPFVGKKDARAEIWSYGHRNPQGLAAHPTSKEIWSSEMGPKGGDELNLIKKGANYGWPVVTFGREYHGPKIGEGTHKKGMEDPVAYWVPSISPSGMDFYNGDAFPEWKGQLFMGNLSGMHLRRIVIKDGKVTSQESLIGDKNYRIRVVRNGPDGFLYFATDAGDVIRLEPKK